jgi:Fe2+ or Zn2+ uptake regulation protein
MYELNIIKEEIEHERITISGKLYQYFKEWLKETKLSEQKIRILNILKREDCFVSLEDLHKELFLSLPLISYHVNGNLKSTGLYDAELIEKTNLKGGRVGVKLSNLGVMILEAIN